DKLVLTSVTPASSAPVLQTPKATSSTLYFDSLTVNAGNGGFLHCIRSEERRVGKECRSRWSACHYKKKKRTSRHSSCSPLHFSTPRSACFSDSATSIFSFNCFSVSSCTFPSRVVLTWCLYVHDCTHMT